MVDTTNLSLKNLQTLSGHKDRVWSLAWDPSGEIFASCSGDKTVKIWGKNATGAWECKTTFGDQHTRTIRSICWSPDAKLLASAGFDSQICIWLKKQDEFECVGIMDGHENEVKSVAWDPKGEFLASSGRDKTVWIWDKDDGYDYSCNSILNGHTQDVKKVAWVPGTLLLASSSYDDTIKFWAPEDDDWTCVSTLKGHESTVWWIEFTKDGKFMASASDDNTIKIWQREEQEEDEEYPKYSLVSTLQGYHSRTIYACTWNHDGTMLASAGADDKICVFVKEEGVSEDGLPSFSVLQTKEQAHFTDINCIQFHPTENLLISCGDDNQIKVWKIDE